MTERFLAILSAAALALAAGPAQANWLDRLTAGGDSADAALQVVDETCVAPMAAGKPPLLPESPGPDDLADETLRARLADAAQLGGDQPMIRSKNPHVFFAGPRVDDFCVAIAQGLSDDGAGQPFDAFVSRMSETHAPGRMMITDARRSVILTKAGPMAFYRLPARGDLEPASAIWAVEMNPEGVPASCFDQQAGPVTCGQE